MQIRPASPRDIPAVLPMVRSVCAFHQNLNRAKYDFLSNPEDRYQRWLHARSEDPRSVFLVAQDDALVGFIVGTTEDEIPIYTIKQYGFIHDLWVEPPFRKRGVARQLLSRAIEQFARIGVPQVRLDVLVHNDPARRLFDACGFRPSTVEMILELP